MTCHKVGRGAGEILRLSHSRRWDEGACRGSAKERQLPVRDYGDSFANTGDDLKGESPYDTFIFWPNDGPCSTTNGSTLLDPVRRRSCSTSVGRLAIKTTQARPKTPARTLLDGDRPWTAYEAT